MHKLYVSILFVTLSAAMCLAVSSNAQAASQSVVISEVQPGPIATPTNELIELYNNANTPVDITDWCLYYASASSQTNGSKLVCFAASGSAVHVFVPAHAYILAISTQLATANPSMGSDVKFSATLSAAAGHVRLLNAQNAEVDKVGWGQAAVAAEGLAPAPASTTTTLLQRKLLDPLTYQDADNNSADFQLAAPRASYAYGALYDEQDICVNIAGIQDVLPIGYAVDVNGICSVLPVDLCVNLPGVQLTLPDNFEQTVDGTCVFSGLPLRITELLPNAAGDDGGREFIELYNPNDYDVDLSYFILKVGPNLEKSYLFMAGTVVAAHSYRTFYNSDVSFTLVNTASRVGLVLVDGTVMDQTDQYTNPPDDNAWANIDSTWQYTDQPTPGSENLISLGSEDVASATTLQPCATNQYRSPETNRCRSLALLVSTLTPCKDGQYRSEETNRCRSLASDVSAQKTCDDDQFRNPATGRCKKIASSDELAVADCGEGRERNPTTNRCRNIAVKSVPDAAFAVEPVKDSGKVFVGWWALGGVGALAIGYGAWEWRREVVQITRKIAVFFSSKK